MRRDVYLYEYENMTFKERLYIVRNNHWDKWLSGCQLINPIDWSVRVMWRAWIKLVFIIIWPVIYWPLVISGAMSLKTRFSKDNDKAWFHSNVKVRASR